MYMFLPFWLIDNYKKSILKTKNNPYNRDDFINFNNSLNWNFSIALIDEIQKQFIKSISLDKCSIDINKLIKNYNFRNTHTNTIFSYIKNFIGIKIYSFNDNICTFENLFSSGKQYKEQQKFSFLLNINKYSCETILGIECGYSHLLRNISKINYTENKQQFFSLPTAIRHALWNDLSDNQKLIFFNLEKTNDPNPNYTSIKLSELLSEIDNQHFWPNISIIKKSFQKFYEHGILQQCETSPKNKPLLNYNDITISYQRNDMDERTNEINSYFSKISQLYLKDTITHNIDNLISIFTLGIEESISKKIRKETLIFLNKNTDNYGKHYVLTATNKIIPILMLFIEWCLRSLKESKLKTPNLLKIFPSIYTYRPEQANMSIIFSGFFKEITDNSTYLNNIINQELVTLVSTKTKNSSIYNDAFQHIYSYGSMSPTSEFLIYFNSQSKFQEAEDIQTKHTLTKEIENPPKLRSNILPSENSLENIVDFCKNNNTDIDISIKEIRQNSRQQYKSLLNSYISSLDVSSKNIVLSIKEKLSENLFEAQIQQRLVDFIYKTSSTTKQNGHQTYIQ
jgi:hypothetical protein